MLIQPRKPRRNDSTVPMLDMAFQILIFFMLAGTIARPLDDGLTLVQTTTLEGTPPPDALVISARGDVTFQGEAMDPVRYLANHVPPGTQIIRIVPDRDAPAATLIAVAAALTAAGAPQVVIVTQKALE